MIALKPYPPVPGKLKSREVVGHFKEIKNKVETDGKIKTKDFKNFWQDKSIRKSLYLHHNKKCCYCERKLNMTRETDVEHFRPKAGIHEDKKHPGYWWLAYDWENYLISCKICNSDYKSNHFPILKGGKRAQKKGDSLALEKSVLIHPVFENPEEFISFDITGSNPYLVKAVGLDKDSRGSLTVNKYTGINHGLMMEMRGSHLLTLIGNATAMKLALKKKNKPLIAKYAEIIKAVTSPDQQFAGLSRAFFRKHGLSDYVSRSR